MHQLTRSAIVLALACSVAAPTATRAATDPNVLCHRTVVKQLEKFKKTHLKLYRNCIDKENKDPSRPDCLDAVSSAKLALTKQKVAEAIAKKCTPANLATLGYLTDCNYGAASPGIGGTCAALPAGTATEFAACMMCWKGAEFARVIATLYASHAQEVCGVTLDDTSATCAAVGCTTPTPEQRDLGNNAENDCQRGLSKATLNYLLKREKILEKCMLRGFTRGACLADPKVDLQLAKAETQKQTLINKFCANRQPVASAPFCCRTGVANQCAAAATREDCLNVPGQSVQEGKECGLGNTCDNPPGNAKAITWWEHCPNNVPCPGPTLGDIDGVIGCVDSIADSTVDTLLCLQFPNGAACATPVPTATPAATPTP